MSDYYTIIPGFFENLPKKASASGVLFYNRQGEILILKPSYKPGWEVPGGMLEAMESPREAATREVLEELGLHKTEFRMLCMDYVHHENPQRDSFQFIFDGGVLTEEEIGNIVLQESEVEEMRFVHLDRISEFFQERRQKRLIAALQNKNDGPVYLEHGDIPVAS